MLNSVCELCEIKGHYKSLLFSDEFSFQRTHLDNFFQAIQVGFCFGI